MQTWVDFHEIWVDCGKQTSWANSGYHQFTRQDIIGLPVSH